MKNAQVVEVRRVGYTMFGLTARHVAGTAILRKLFNEGSTWSGETLYIDQRYVDTVIRAVGKRIKFQRVDRVRPSC